MEAEERLGPGAPVYLDESDPRIADHSVGVRVHDWHPANGPAIKMVRCLEAIRDLAPIFNFVVNSPTPDSDNRIVKMMATPLYTLATGVRDVYGEIENSDLRRMHKNDRRAFLKRKEAFSNAVFQGKNGPLKTVRDKIGAHIDTDTILSGERVWKHVSLQTFVELLRLCLLELDYLLQNDIYAWTRNTDRENLVRLMSVDGSLVDFVTENNQPKYIARLSFVKSPREGIAREVNAFVATVNLIVARMSERLLL